MSDDRRRLVRATTVNALGLAAEAGRVVVPLALIATYSSAEYGVLVAGLGAVELVQRLVVTGFANSVQYLAAREEGRSRASGGAAEADPLPRVVATGLLWSTGAALVLALGIQLVAGLVYRVFYDGTQPASLVTAVRILAWSLPLQALAAIPLAALTSRLLMGPDVAVNKLVVPLATLGLAWLLQGRLEGPVAMATAHLGGSVVAVGLAWLVFARRFPPVEVGRALVRRGTPGLSRDLLGFAAPQGAGAFAGVALERGDALVLAAFVAPSLVTLYAVASELGRLVRTVKVAFSSVLSPLLARQAAEHGPAGMQESLDMVAGWIARAALPAVFVVLAFRHELFALYSQPGPPAFLPLLLVGPLASCAFGLAGNALLMTGHARLSLGLSSSAMGAGLLLALALVPVLGATGAAVASAASQLGLVLAQRRVVRRRLGIRIGLAGFRQLRVAGVLLAAVGLGLELLPTIVAGWPLQVARLTIGIVALAGYTLATRGTRG